MLGQDDWRCPTCLDLCFKPAVNSVCGHVMCFWCIHQAMSPFSPSACPICRARYTNLPAICPKLHHFLAVQFPEAYRQRHEETEAEEQERAAASPEPPYDGPLPLPPGPSLWQPQHFSCDHPSCGRLLCRPLVLNCGHSVCTECLPGGLARAAAGRTAAVPVDGSATSGGSAGSSAATAGPAAEVYKCPACGMAARCAPAVCKQMADLLRELFPGESAQREAGFQAALAAQQAQQAAGPAAGTEAVEAAAAAPASEPSMPRPAVVAGPGDSESRADEQPAQAAVQQQQQGTAGPPDEAEQQRQREERRQQALNPEALSPSLTAALRRRQAGGGPDQVVAQRMEQRLRMLTTGDEYIHHGVGCDSCGLPRIYWFDLCGTCYDLNRRDSSIVGRFNQRHTPEHRVHLVRPRLTAMHMLQAANPELSMEQLMWLVEMATTPEREEEQQGQGQPQQHANQQQEQQQEQPGGQPAQAPGGGSSTDGGDGSPEHLGVSAGPASEEPMLLRRGPRPAYDASAQEPSPSAYAPQHLQQHGGAGSAAAGASQQQQQQPSGPATAEAQGLVEDGEEEEVTAVHVPLERIMQGQPRGGSGGGDAGGGESPR